jgi:hypothetical protein
LLLHKQVIVLNIGLEGSNPPSGISPTVFQNFSVLACIGRKHNLELAVTDIAGLFNSSNPQNMAF